VIDLSKYIIEALGKDKEFNLYRAKSKDDESHVLLLSPVAEYPASETLERLEHEYSLREELDPAWAAQPIAITQQWDRTVLVLEDPGGVPLDQLVGEPLDLAFSLRVAIGLSNVIDRLHQRGLIHKDIKPANVLVNSVSGRCWLKGFGIASRLPRERQSVEPPEFIAGTLAYMAPEQTGRMNRSIDSRSDLYSLGVTLYEMLTGSLPFTASDPMEWVHCHIARQPVPPNERSKDAPASVSAIIMKLLAKTAEERYQTAAGAESDFRRCLAAWETQRRIDEFPLGEHDAPDRLLIPEKLYGRAPEIDTLLASFERVVASGTPELVLVSGYSGIGKSSVVNELHKVLVPPRGLFASGKFDQYKRDIPYATLAQAFQSLIRLLLSKSEAELQNWRDTLREALGPNGQLIVDLVPELKLIIGEQPPVPELPPQDAQRRFQLVFRRFIGVFARREHPLALFLDDMQWLDAATFDLLEDLLTRPDVHHLMLIGAYRDNEVNSAHPLMRKLEAIRQGGAIVHEISLAPLAREDLGRLIADALHCEPARVAPLAQLVQEKTAGNPFFAIQFISALGEEALLTFDYSNGIWSWDLNRIHAKGYTDNVVDLMVDKLNRLPQTTQKALQQLACLGNFAEDNMLSIVHGTSEDELHSDLWEAARPGYIVRLNGSYRFVHDRVQEAAYSLIPEESRAEAHLRVGRLLTAHTPPGRLEEVIFEIVNQINRGAALITSQEERDQIAELNLVAGKRAKASTAYASALNYLVAGAALLTDDFWERRHELGFALELHRAECEFLTGELAAAAERLTMLSSRAANTVEQATVACLRMDLYMTLGQSDRAVGVCIEYLRHLGIVWSPHPTEDEARREYERIWSQVGIRAIEDLIDLPLMSDPASIATLDVLTKVLSPAQFTDANFLSLAVCRAVNLSLERGNSDGSCVTYVWFGMIAGSHFGNYKAGFRFGRLGYELVEQRGLNRFQARTYLWFGEWVMPWTKHVEAGRDLMRRAFEAANKVGDLTVAAYSCDALNTNLLAGGDPLPEVQRQAENGLEFARKARFGIMIGHITGQLGLIRSLRGLTLKFGYFDDEQFDELRFERHLASETVFELPECWYWIRKLQARFFAGDYASAVDASLRAQRLLWTSASMFAAVDHPGPFFETAEYHFYAALARAAVHDFETPDGQLKHFQALTEHHKQLALWAENCPENFENRAALVGAEIARIEGREFEAMRLYEQAIRSSHTNGFVHNEALASELAARFYVARGFNLIAHAHLRKARFCYLRWGAAGKVRQLDELYPGLSEDQPEPGPTSTLGTPVEHLDLDTVLKVSQAVSGEVVLEKLIDMLMRTAIEHAGAERGLLILCRSGERRIEADATTSGDTIVVRLLETPAADAAVPDSIVHYVARTHESVILEDASAQHPFSADAYFRRQHARSILCTPLINQAKLIGLLYLENNLAPHIFTPDRITVLKVLASQAAISLENSRLYRDLKEREEALRQSEAYLSEAQRLSHTGSFGWDVTGRKIYWSQETFRIFAYDPATEPTLELVLQRTHPEDKRMVRELFDRVSTEKKFFDFEHRLLMPDGSAKYLRVVGHPSTKDESGRFEFVGAVTDITERRRAEEAVSKAQAELAHVSRVVTMGELTTSIAHEVNQPLTAALNSASACVRWLAANELDEARQSTSRVIASVRRASEIIAGIRALAKKAPPQKELLDLNETIGQAIVMVRSELHDHNVSLQTQLANNLPLIKGDRVQLQQVILNLFINAIEAMAEIEEDPRILSVSSERTTDVSGDPGDVLIGVRDSGPGLDMKSLDRLFDSFYTTKSQGLGMGLAISRSIIEAHGGRLWAENAVQGAIFRFSLPIQNE
jgi:PAS domain S-box-containing protein